MSVPSPVPASSWPLWLRRLVQLATLFLFLWLFLVTGRSTTDVSGPQLSWFLRFDPLLLLSDVLAHGWPQAILLWSLLLVLATLVLGRFFCGWLCPMGTLLDAFARAFVPKRLGNGSPRLRNLKYYLLIALLLPIPLFSHLMGLLDPLCLLTRSLAISGYPAAIWLAEKLGAFYETPAAVVTEPIYQFLRDHFIPQRENPAVQSLFWPTLVVFAGVFGLEFFGRRFWCRNLCPLGGLLSGLSAFALLKRRPVKVCKDCGECTQLCKATGFAADGVLRTAECLECLRCQVECPKDRIRFKLVWARPSPKAPDLTRRALVTSIAAGAVAGPALAAGGDPSPHLIRPPGAEDEDLFLRRCARCGACMKTCPTQGLQPTLLEAGLTGLWTPTLVPRQGYCEVNCTLCGQVCPTGAIPRLHPAEKLKVNMGVALFDPKVCLPFAKHENCLVCEEHCPTGQKAIVFDARRIETPEGPKDLLFPRVKRDLCIGCGICENKCPLEPKRGVLVYHPTAVPPEPPPPPGTPITLERPQADPYGGGGGE